MSGVSMENGRGGRPDGAADWWRADGVSPADPLVAAESFNSGEQAHAAGLYRAVNAVQPADRVPDPPRASEPSPAVEIPIAPEAVESARPIAPEPWVAREAGPWGPTAAALATDPEPPVAGLEELSIAPARPYASPPRPLKRPNASRPGGPPTPRRIVVDPPAIFTAPAPPPGVDQLVDERAIADLSTVDGRVEGLTEDETNAALIPVPPEPRSYPVRPPRPTVQRRRRYPGRPWYRLPILLALMLVATFLAWVSAEPFWLAAGHGTAGVATVVDGPSRCQASFTASDASFNAPLVDLAGMDAHDCAVGAQVPAQMVSADATRAYVLAGTGIRLRWLVGLVLLLLCGLGIVWATGAGRFRGAQRLFTVGASLAAPLAIAAVMLALSY